MKDRIITGILTIICAIATYVSVSCYYKISEYDAKLVSLNVLLNQQSEMANSLNAEDLVILRKFDLVDKRFTEVEKQIKVNDIRITEIGAKVGKKK